MFIQLCGDGLYCNKEFHSKFKHVPEIRLKHDGNFVCASMYFKKGQLIVKLPAVQGYHCIQLSAR